MQCFARLVRLLLGPSALSNNKLGFGPALEILGVQLFLSEEGYTAVPSKKTMQKCLRAVQKALAEDVLPGGAAQKLAGRLNWAGQYLFHRVGRAMLRPIYDQKFSKCVLNFSPCHAPCLALCRPLRDGSLGEAVKVALRWWGVVLQCGAIV